MAIRRRFEFVVGSAAVAAALALIVGVGPAHADDPVEPSPEKGQMLAERLCSGCHVVDSASKVVPAGIPPLRAIANRPDQTAQRIINILIKPHAPMPDMQLSQPEMLDIISYLDTLRAGSGLPPMLPKNAPKPKYPEPS